MNQHQNNGQSGKSHRTGRGRTKINWTDQDPDPTQGQAQDSTQGQAREHAHDPAHSADAPQDPPAPGADASTEQMADQRSDPADPAPGARHPDQKSQQADASHAADPHAAAGDTGAFDVSELADQDAAIESSGDDVDSQAADSDSDAARRAEELEQRLLRTVADYQNLARRSRLDVEAARKQQAMDMARSLLSVLDNFDHALAVDPEKADAQSLLKGVTMVRDELLRALESFQIKRLDVEPGTEFDPNCHEAMMRQPAEGIETNQVTQQLQPGYTIGDKTLRPAKVAVAP